MQLAQAQLPSFKDPITLCHSAAMVPTPSSKQHDLISLSLSFSLRSFLLTQDWEISLAIVVVVVLLTLCCCLCSVKQYQVNSKEKVHPVRRTIGTNCNFLNSGEKEVHAFVRVLCVCASVRGVCVQMATPLSRDGLASQFLRSHPRHFCPSVFENGRRGRGTREEGRGRRER